MSFKKAILGLSFLIVFGWCLFSTTKSLSPEKHFEEQWTREVHTWLQEKKLPSEFLNLQSVHFIEGDPQAAKWLQAMQAPFETHSAGQHRLDVLVLSWEDGPKLGFVIQYDLVNLENGNTIFESGHTFTVDKPQP